MNSKEKLVEATIKALQDKLSESEKQLYSRKNQLTEWYPEDEDEDELYEKAKNDALKSCKSEKLKNAFEDMFYGRTSADILGEYGYAYRNNSIDIEQVIKDIMVEFDLTYTEAHMLIGIMNKYEGNVESYICPY